MKIVRCLPLLIPGLVGLSVPGAEAQVSAAKDPGSPAITVVIQTLPPEAVVVREVVGSYEQHPAVFKELMQYAGKEFKIVGLFFGIYPQDPDGVAQRELHWQVAIRIDPSTGERSRDTSRTEPELRKAIKALHPPLAPYKLDVLAETQAGVIESTIARAPKDGLAMYPWMAENGYVQTGPTRMEYLSYVGTPETIKVRIIVPMKKRPSGLQTPNRDSTNRTAVSE